MKKYSAIPGACLAVTCTATGITSSNEGSVEYTGAQKDIFSKGMADRIVSRKPA